MLTFLQTMSLTERYPLPFATACILIEIAESHNSQEKSLGRTKRSSETHPMQRHSEILARKGRKELQFDWGVALPGCKTSKHLSTQAGKLAKARPSGLPSPTPSGSKVVGMADAYRFCSGSSNST